MAKRTTYDILFILIVSAICHFLFSKYGFNPTDEGFVLSATNRVLHGQIPHVDFSSVRPLGYAYLHIPELLISKNYVFLISRFVFWLEQVLIAFLWIRFVFEYFKIKSTSLNKYSLIIVCFVFNVHYFPCSVLHTIDGLLMCMIGLNIILSEKKWNFIGFFFIGFAALCKQNYLVVLPITLFLFNRKNIVLNSITGFLPIIFYISLISLYSGWNDLVTQLTGHNELLLVGVKNYVFNYYFLAGVLFAYLVKKIKIPVTIYLAFLYIILIGLLISNHYHGKVSFLIFGMLVTELFHPHTEIDFRKIVLITMLLAWCVSISVGYNTPALFLGGCFSFIIIKLNYEKLILANKYNYLLVLLLFVIFCVIRETNVYRDKNIKHLTYKLDNIVEGANGIYTNKNTYLVLKEMDSLKSALPNLIVVPDFTACNILHSHTSKILTEWPNKTEIPNKKILEKVVSKINNDTSLIFAIPIFQTALLKDSLTLQKDNGLNYPIVKFVKENYKKINFTTYFELRRK